MDRNIYDNDFEDFLKQKSDQYKMYPSDRVWNNVYSSLHGRKKWWALGFGLFFIGAGLLVGKEVLLSNFNKAAQDINQSTETFSATNNSTTHTSKNNSTPVTSASVAKTNSTTNTVAENSRSNTTQLITNTNNFLPVAAAIAPGKNKQHTVPNADAVATGSADNNKEVTSASINPETGLIIENDLLSAVPITSGNNLPATSVSIPANAFLIDKDIAGKEKGITKEQASPVINQVENAATIARPGIKVSRFSLQFYASPTISYRRLSTISQSGISVVPVVAGYAGNINNYVRHKPAPGFEVGSNVQYRLSENLTVFAGAQLNYSRYYIDAFKYRTEKASLAVNNARVRDTLSGYTNIRNFNGYSPEQLQNKYLQLSVPVGIEIKLLGHKKLQFSVAGGVQPTFLLSSTSYLISSDYKNYIQSPDLARGFNVHTNFEAFISYKVAGLKWQVGPQFRSQLLSSYSNQYRVREYLTEYGIKFGVSKSF